MAKEGYRASVGAEDRTSCNAAFGFELASLFVASEVPDVLQAIVSVRRRAGAVERDLGHVRAKPRIEESCYRAWTERDARRCGYIPSNNRFIGFQPNQLSTVSAEGQRVNLLAGKKREFCS